MIRCYLINVPKADILDCIYSKNITRNMLLKYPTNEEFNRFIKFKFNTRLENFSINYKIIKSIDFRLKRETPKKIVTIIFNETIINTIKSQQIFLRISMKSQLYRKANYIEKPLIISHSFTYILHKTQF